MKTIFSRIKFHRFMRKMTVLPGLCLAAFLCAGCSGLSENGFETGHFSNTVSKEISMETTPIVDYQVPEPLPNIWVDMSGYRVWGAKRAVVRGRRLPETFQLVDASTGEVVFVDELENAEYNEEQKLYCGYADFRNFDKTGTYYLECQYIGRSYFFELSDTYYETFFEELCESISQDLKTGNITVTEINQILQAYEWYGEVFADKDRDEIPDMLYEIRQWIETTESTWEIEGKEAEYTVLLAKFGFLYQTYDYAYATDCLKRGIAIFEKKQDAMQGDVACFRALTELYRATGRATYKTRIAEYKSYFENHMNLTAKDGYLYGAMTYLNTRQSVDLPLCTRFMETVMDQGESISGLYGDMIHPITPHNDGEEDLLGHGAELACANYIMNNYQYNRVLEELLHYLRGRNPQAVDFYENTTGNQKSSYLLLLSQLVAVQENMK